MLILDVKTRWSSTHQMLRKRANLFCSLVTWFTHGIPVSGCALDYRNVIDNFVAKNQELRSFKLSTADWDAVVLVTKWLKSFRSATTQMSATKCSMLSSTHAIFHGLQEDIRNSLTELPNSAPAKLKTSLIKAHRKLSDYYTKLDKSPYYVWSSCEWFLIPHCYVILSSYFHLISVLDPRISYQGLLADCGDDISLKSHIELAKEHLTTCYQEQYMPQAPTTAPQPLAPKPSSRSPQKVNFTARYKQRSRTDIDELEEFWKLPQEDFENCDPVQWWASRRAQFPGLSRYARDIFSIPGRCLVAFAKCLLLS